MKYRVPGSSKLPQLPVGFTCTVNASSSEGFLVIYEDGAEYAIVLPKSSARDLYDLLKKHFKEKSNEARS